jgi:tetratricopeptide (TPR) repeat protein
MSDAVARAAAGVVTAEDGSQGAIRRLEERLARDPNSLAFAALADAYRKVGRVSEAIALCRDGLGRIPHYTTARLVLAKSLIDQGDEPAALAELHTVVAGAPRDAEAHRLIGDIHRRAGQIDEAVAHLERALRLDPADREARLTLELLRGSKRLPEGSPLAGVLADDTFVTRPFGRLCLEQGLVEEAVHVFVRLLARHPGDQEIGEELERAVRAKTQRRKGS